jgi:NAD(P)-dependent dehydrogenase (short-subunit alcohol dehydrogenase family)
MKPVAVVTGATGGIGRWIALGLARAGYHTILVGRDEARGAAAQAWIAAQLPGASTEPMLADLSSIAATRDLGRRIAAAHPALSLLVANAGVFRARREETAEGHEMVLAVNHLSPFVLIDTLQDALVAGAPSRIVVVGSSTSDRARIDPGNLELTRGWGMVRAYGQSKLAVMIATFGWAERLRASGVTANVVHPGTVATGLVRSRGVIGLPGG